MIRILDYTKEGLIIRALMRGPMSYKELKNETGMSDAWLSRKLKELMALRVVLKDDGTYKLSPAGLMKVLSQSKEVIARAMAFELVRNRDVMAVILFGSLARGDVEGDIDLLVITRRKELDEVKVSLELFKKFGVAVDIVSVTLRDFLKWLDEKPPLLFQVAIEGVVLYDRACIGELLSEIASEIAKNYTYLGEVKLWVKKLSKHT